MLREITEAIADFIREDETLAKDGHVKVIVEDKADIGFAVESALGSLGVAVTVAVTGFRRTDRSPIPQGNLELQLSCFENPTLNRDDASTLTAQGVIERIVKILHYKEFPFLVGQMIFTDFQRDDVDEANIVRGNFLVNTCLGYEDGYFHPEENETENQPAEAE